MGTPSNVSDKIEKTDIEKGPSAQGTGVQMNVASIGFWRNLFFLQIEGLIWRGQQKRLEIVDMFSYPTLKSSNLYNLFDKGYTEVKKSQPDGPVDLRKVVLQGNFIPIIWTGVLYGVSQGCTIVGPLILQKIVSGIDCQSIAEDYPNSAIGPCPTKGTLYLYCIALFGSPIIQTFAENHMNYGVLVIGTRMRNSLMAAVYRKCLRLSSSAMQKESLGKVVTLMSNDAQKIQDAAPGFHALWCSPIFVCVVLGLLWVQVGWAMFVGLGIMLLTLPTSGKLAGILGKLRQALLPWTDKRVGIMSEIISNMQIIKYYAWENSFKQKALDARANEAKVLYQLANWQCVFILLLFVGPVAVAVFVFGSYTIAGHVIPVANAYAALTLFSLLRLPMSFLPMYIQNFVNATVSMKRIAKFLNHAEMEDTVLLEEAEPSTRPGPVAEGTEAASPSGAAAEPGSPGFSPAQDPSESEAHASSEQSGSGYPIHVPIEVVDSVTTDKSGGTESRVDILLSTEITDMRVKAELPSCAAAARPRVKGYVHIRNGEFSWTADEDAKESGVNASVAVVTAGAEGKGGEEPSAAKDKSAWEPKGVVAPPAATVAQAGAEPTPAAAVLPADDVSLATSSSTNASPASTNLPEKSEKQAAARAESSAFVAKSTLVNVNLVCNPGSLVVVVGSVGCGKSSLLSAVLGLIPRLHGEVVMVGRAAYVAQTAWIMNDTLQENVLLGEPMEAERYQKALEVSQLLPDIAILPKGDLTEIGDRGINLSGGQKQRVSIARAVYSNADVIVMDDPLSAVDSHVCASLFEQCIKGVLKGKTILLATNALQFLPQADHVVWIEKGMIRAQGSYDDVVKSGLDMKDLVHLSEDEDEEPEEAVLDAVLPLEGPSEVTPAQGAPRLSVDLRTAKRASKELKQADNVTLQKVHVDMDRNLTGTEARVAGGISYDILKSYVLNSGASYKFFALILMFAIEQTTRAYTDTWVGIWFGGTYNLDQGVYLGIYAGLGVFYGIVSYVRSLTMVYMTVASAVTSHNKMLNHLLLLPKSFFDTSPGGSILNRFSRDTEIMDTVLPQSLIQFTGSVAVYISTLIVIAIATKVLIAAIVPLTIIYFIIQRYYIPSAREMQRIESVTRSPIYSRFSEALAGISTIRAYRKEAHFIALSDELMERNGSAYLTMKCASSWLSMRLDVLGVIISTLTGFVCIQGLVSPGMAGLAIMYSLNLTAYLKFGSVMAAQTETNFNSVERILEYLPLEPEASHETPPEVEEKLDPKWPDKGELEVVNVSMQYRPGMPLVLKDVSFRVQPGEKVGVVGRTGSGKSSLFLVLFRMVEPAGGTVYIDGIDYKTLGLHRLRSSMSIIPQDPFMFTGNVRRNLDPLGNLLDDVLWVVLEECGLKEAIGALDGKLDAPVTDSGANFSVGQRQLFCVARAMLRNSRILMLDEATASVDLETDAMLQNVIRNRFANSTALTIAHRLSTIVDSDRVIVLSHGEVVENGHPDDLLKKSDGVFMGMVDQTGKGSARYLKNMATFARRTFRDEPVLGAVVEESQT